MKTIAARAVFLDASVLVKLYIDENNSTIVRGHIRKEPTTYTTPFCFYEALGALKMKWLRRNILQSEYLNASFALMAWFSSMSSNIKDLDFTSPTIFNDVKRIAKENHTDLSDAFQIVSVKTGYFSPLVGKSKTILATADKKLAEIGRKEALRVWYVLDGPPP